MNKTKDKYFLWLGLANFGAFLVNITLFITHISPYLWWNLGASLFSLSITIWMIYLYYRANYPRTEVKRNDTTTKS